jgi:hypothetical protein
VTKAKISEYSATANDNTDVNNVNIAEGCAPSGINNAIREVMAALKRFQTGTDSDPVTIGGNLNVTGATALNTLSATNVTASGTLGVTGASTFTGTLSALGNASVGGTLGVTGASTFTGTLSALGNVSVGGAMTVSGVTVLSSRGTIKALFETVTTTGSAPATTTNFDVITQAVQFYTSNADKNFTFNVRGDSSSSLDSILSTGQSATIALLVTNGSTGYYPTTFQVDGSNVTPKWQGGTAPTAGNANSVDNYVLNIVKTGSATFTVFASQSKFA